jgi:hypothetical protein
VLADAFVDSGASTTSDKSRVEEKCNTIVEIARTVRRARMIDFGCRTNVSRKLTGPLFENRASETSGAQRRRTPLCSKAREAKIDVAKLAWMDIAILRTEGHQSY